MSRHVISIDKAAELARAFVEKDPLNSAVDLVPVDGMVAVVDGGAYFGFQERAYVETGDPSRMVVGIGPVRVDLVTGECRVLGAVEGAELGLFGGDDLALAGPGGWRLVPPEVEGGWRAVFDAEPRASDLGGACPGCGARELHRWYRVDEPLDEVFDGVRAVAYGWLVEWCAACHLCHEDGDAFVPDFWESPYDVPDAHGVDFAPRRVEAARSGQLG